MHMEMRQDIQILRGVAVLLVVLFHLQVSNFSNGFLGVDIFFVISGFLMAKLYRQGTKLDFYRRRVDRLLPAYAVVIVTALFAASFRTIPVDFWQLAEQSYASAIFASNIQFWNQNSYFDKTAFKPLLNLWSLAIEAQFYLIVPFLFPLLERRRHWTLLLITISFLACLLALTVSPKTAFFLLPFRVYEFMFGAWVAWHQSQTTATQQHQNMLRTLWSLVLAVVVFVIPLNPVSVSIVDGHPGLVAAVAAFATSQLIRLGLPEVIIRSLAGRALALLGDYSYSIYLIHFPVIVLWNYVPFDGTNLRPESILDLIGIVACFTLLSALSFNLIERKYAGLFKSGRGRVALPLAVLVAAFSALHINAAGYTATDNNIFAAWTDRSQYRCGKLFRILHPASEICLVSKKYPGKSMLLVGNSHADSIKTKMAEASQDNGFSLFFLSGNRPLLDSDGDGMAILSESATLGVNSVVVHFNNIYGQQDAQQRIIAFLINAKKMGMRTAMIAPVPYFDVHVPKEMYLHGNTSGNIRMSRAVHEMRISSFIRFSELLAKNGIPVYDPSKVLCPSNDNCKVSDDEMKPFYFDESHLTLTGSDILLDMFRQIANANNPNSK